jgi:iron-sulfur cluster repair protein YtfE (RIC family)
MNPHLFILDSKICDLTDNYPWLISIIDILHIDINSSATVAEISKNDNIKVDFIAKIILNAIIRGIPDYTIPTLDTGHTINDIVNYIVTHHHLYLRTELPRLIKSGQQINYTNYDSSSFLPELLVFLQGLNITLNNHFDKEETEVFPFIVHENSDVINNGLRQAILLMEFEHSHVNKALNQLSLMTDNFHIGIDANTRIKELIISLNKLTKTFDEHLYLEEQLIHDLIFSAEN